VNVKKIYTIKKTTQKKGRGWGGGGWEFPFKKRVVSIQQLVMYKLTHFL